MSQTDPERPSFPAAEPRRDEGRPARGAARSASRPLSRPASRGDSWFDDEPNAAVLRAELRRLYRRNRNHPWPLILLTLVATLFGLYRGYTRRPTYEARIALRIIENDVDVETRPRPAAALRAWIADVALGDGNLIGIIERLNPYPKARLRGLDQALADLREDIGVEVWRNEFLSEGPRDPIGRAARVALTYQHGDPDIAWKVTEALADATVAEQRRMRRAQVEILARGMDPALTRAQATLKARQADLSRALRDSATSQVAAVRALSLKEEIDGLSRDVDQLRASRDEAQLRLQAEMQNLALQVAVIDIEKPEPQPRKAKTMIIFASVFGLSAFLLGGVVIKAFDRRLFDAEDVARLGLPVWGALPAYPGDDEGSMRRRQARKARTG